MDGLIKCGVIVVQVREGHQKGEVLYVIPYCEVPPGLYSSGHPGNNDLDAARLYLHDIARSFFDRKSGIDKSKFVGTDNLYPGSAMDRVQDRDPGSAMDRVQDRVQGLLQCWLNRAVAIYVGNGVTRDEVEDLVNIMAEEIVTEKALARLP